MKHLKNKHQNFAEAYKTLLIDCINDFDNEVSPRGLKVKELEDYIYTIESPLKSVFKNNTRSTPMNYLKAEIIWYFSGSNNINFIKRFSKFWNKLTNPDGNTVNSSYGNLIFKRSNVLGVTSWEWAKKNLIEDKFSRKALIKFNDNSHDFFGNRDYPCTLTGLFTIRNNKLKLTIDQRSCDLIKGITFDVPFFTLIQHYMVEELKEYYPNLELGPFTHVIHNAHIYERDFKLVEDMLKTDFNSFDISDHTLPDLTSLINFSKDKEQNKVLKPNNLFLAWLNELE